LTREYEDAARACKHNRAISIVAISSSVRASSFNTTLLHAATDGAPASAG
jgi:hypothetical protein